MKNQTKKLQNTLFISHDVFKGLIRNFKCETGDEIDTIGFSSKYKRYEISFHAFNEDGYDVIVEDFGMMSCGKWIQMIPTANQVAIMKIQIEIKFTEIRINMVNAENEIYRQIENARDEEKYGNEGAIYSKYY